MKPHIDQSLEAAVMRLEMQYRSMNRWNNVWKSIAVAVGALAFLGAKSVAVPDVLGAKNFMVFDENDKPRVIFNMNDRGPGMSIFDPDGVVRLDLRAREGDSSALTLYGTGKGLAQIAVIDDEPVVQLTADNNNKKAEIISGVHKDGSSFLEMNTLKGEKRLYIAVGPDGSPRIQLLDEKEEIVNSLTGKR